MGVTTRQDELRAEAIDARHDILLTDTNAYAEALAEILADLYDENWIPTAICACHHKSGDKPLADAMRRIHAAIEARLLARAEREIDAGIADAADARYESAMGAA